MSERRYSGEIERLRSPERVARLEISRVIDLSLAELDAKSVLDIVTDIVLIAWEPLILIGSHDLICRYSSPFDDFRSCSQVQIRLLAANHH
jgi:hypothetical protein